MGTDQSRIMDQDPSLASTCSGTLIVSFEKDKNDGLFSKKKQHIYKQKASKAFLPHKRSLRNMFDKRKRIESKKKELRDENLVEYHCVHLIDVCGLPSLKDGARASIVFRIGQQNWKMARCLNWADPVTCAHR